jgi:hypothetical protein
MPGSIRYDAIIALPALPWQGLCPQSCQGAVPDKFFGTGEQLQSQALCVFSLSGYGAGQTKRLRTTVKSNY